MLSFKKIDNIILSKKNRGYIMTKKGNERERKRAVLIEKLKAFGNGGRKEQHDFMDFIQALQEIYPRYAITAVNLNYDEVVFGEKYVREQLERWVIEDAPDGFYDETLGMYAEDVREAKKAEIGVKVFNKRYKLSDYVTGKKRRLQLTKKAI